MRPCLKRSKTPRKAYQLARLSDSAYTPAVWESVVVCCRRRHVQGRVASGALDRTVPLRRHCCPSHRVIFGALPHESVLPHESSVCLTNNRSVAAVGCSEWFGLTRLDRGCCILHGLARCMAYTTCFDPSLDSNPVGRVSSAGSTRMHNVSVSPSIL